MTEREDLERELAELEAKNAAATSWGAAVGARHERINGIRKALAADPAQDANASEKLHDALGQAIGWIEECGSDHEGRQCVLNEARSALRGIRLIRNDAAAMLPVAILRQAGASNGGLVKLPSGREVLLSKSDAAALRSPAACEAEIEAWIRTLDTEKDRNLLMWMERAKRAEALVERVKEALSDCRDDFNRCPRCDHQDNDAMRESNLVLILDDILGNRPSHTSTVSPSNG